MHVGFWWEGQKERDNYENIDVGERIILKWILEKQNVLVWTGIMWIIRGTSGGSCEHCYEPSGSIKFWEILE
jgi:hypothetical protein